MSQTENNGSKGIGAFARTSVPHHGNSIFELVDRQYRQAAQRKLQQVSFSFSTAAEISSVCGRIFSIVEQDDEQRRIARLAWIIKSTVFQTMLQFDDPRLRVKVMADEMMLAASTFPALESTVETLVRLMGALVATAHNPKREWLLTQLTGGDRQGLPIAILAGLQGAGTPGWPVAVSPTEDFRSDLVTLVRTKKDIRGRVFSTVVVPGPVRFTTRPLLHDLLYGGRALNIAALAYGAERTYFPQPITMPIDSTFGCSEFRKPRTELQVVDSPDNPLDHWASATIWDEIRLRNLESSPASDRDVSVPARFVLFADGSGAFLPDDKRVVELSELLDRGGNVDTSEERLPRKNVRDLEEHDLIMLRLSGSGNYLDDVADSEMDHAGLGDLRREATEWKPWLYRAIKEHGEGLVARTGREFGLRLRSATYLWEWAGDGVMAPHDFTTFRALIATLVKLEPTAISSDVDLYAIEKWRQMEQVKTFHARAGAAIRTALIQRVKGLVAERRIVETVESIELPGVEAGRMGLLRVSAVDSRPVRTPQSRLFHVFPLKGDTSWQK